MYGWVGLTAATSKEVKTLPSNDAGEGDFRFFWGEGVTGIGTLFCFDLGDKDGFSLSPVGAFWFDANSKVAGGTASFLEETLVTTILP